MQQQVSGGVAVDQATISLPDFRLLFEAAPDLFLVLTRDLRVAAASDSFLAATQTERAPMLGRMLDDVFRGTTPALKRSLARVLETHAPDTMDAQSSDAWAATTLPAGPTERRWRATNTAVLGAQNVVQYIIHRLEDVTELADLHLLEEEFREAQKLEGIAQLASGVAHDFNNVLTVILSYARFVKADLGVDHASSPDMAEIEKAAGRAIVLTRQLLAFSRKQVLDPKILDLNHVVAGSESMLRRLVHEDVELVIQLAPDLGRVKSDRGHIEQILTNLIMNARDAMPTGGKLTVATANVQLEPTDSGHDGPAPGGSYVMLSVEDTGLGMDASALANLFVPFWTTKGPTRAGLGLAVVHGVVKQAGGEITIDSAPGRGCRVKVYLPRYLAPEPHHALGGRLSFAPGSRTVLIVEDEVAVRAAAERALTKAGYNVVNAASPEDALRLCAGSALSIDLLLSDVVMPGLDGPSLARQLQVERPALKVLFMSGYTNGALVNHGVLEAGKAFLQKPFNPDTLAEKVDEALQIAPTEGALP